MFSCHICTTKIQVKDTVWEPERLPSNTRVYPML